MSVSSDATVQVKREEALKLFISLVQQPLNNFNQGDIAAYHAIRGADLLLNYIESGTIENPEKAKQLDSPYVFITDYP
jgi:hypothetical protein